VWLLVGAGAAGVAAAALGAVGKLESMRLAHSMSWLLAQCELAVGTM
jgi:hypothetical protein